MSQTKRAFKYVWIIALVPAIILWGVSVWLWTTFEAIMQWWVSFLSTSAAGLGYTYFAWRWFRIRVHLYSMHDVMEAAISPLRRIRSPLGPSSPDADVLYLTGVELRNIRCFENVSLSFNQSGEPIFTTLFLGDNAAGKSTILRSIALGLCPESDAVSLMKALPGRFLRKGKTEGSIVLHLRSQNGSATIRTAIKESDSYETVRQQTEPSNFPWERVFVCGYGTHRTEQAASSYEGYLSRLAVTTLFNDKATLQNPEVVLLRREKEVQEKLQSALRQVLMMDKSDFGFSKSNEGLLFTGPWGRHPLSSASDGFRCTTQWVLDFLGW